MFSSSLRTLNRSAVQKIIAGSVGVTGLTASYLLYQDSMTAQAMTAAEHGLHAPAYGWSHNGMLDAFDHASIRRGYQVYREVCACLLYTSRCV